MITLKAKDTTFTLEERESYYQKLLKELPKPSVLLQTCNRTELYSGKGPAPINIVKHLFRVTSGLESTLIGETAIQSQVKTAYQKATEQNKLSKELHSLFQNAIRVGKRIRHETAISRGATSHSQILVDFLTNQNIDLTKMNITIIGVHNLANNLLNYLIKKGATTIFIGNRTYEKATLLAKKHNCHAFKLETLNNVLNKTDILISATSAPHIIIRHNNIPKNKEMTIFDLAVPRDVDSAISKLNNIKLYNIANLETLISKNLMKRKNEIIKAEEIIDQELEKYSQKNETTKY
jgi:glutamyl-tRNA reductase